MHNKTKNIEDLNIRSMIYLVAMVENNFLPSNAALDIPKAISGSVSYQVKRLEQTFEFDVFIWGKRESSHEMIHALGLTENGKTLYKSVKWFLRSLMIDTKYEREGGKVE